MGKVKDGVFFRLVDEIDVKVNCTREVANMSLLIKLRHHLPSVFSSKSVPRPLSPLNFTNINGMITRGYAQSPGIDEEEEEEPEEIEIDRRRLPADYDPSTFDPTEHRSLPTDLVLRLVDEMAGLTMAELLEFGPILMRKMGMKELPTVAVLKPGAAGLAAMTMNASTAVAKEEKKPEKTVFELKLVSYEATAKIKVIKEVRSFTDLG